MSPKGTRKQVHQPLKTDTCAWKIARDPCHKSRSAVYDRGLMKQTLREYVRPFHQLVTGTTALDIRKLALGLRGVPGFLASAQRYRAQARGGPFPLRLSNLYPNTADR